MLTLRAAESGVGEVHLDVYELDVGVATLLPGGTALATRTEPYSPYGQRLVVALPEPSKAAAEYKIAIRYTVGETPALCWLAREQTAGKTKPYLYTQGQACLNRGFFPTQDTPCIKAPFSATVRVPAGFTVAMSGLPDNTAAATAAAASTPGEAVFAFVQPMPIPAYLIAMAVGDLESRSIGPRSKVWAEPCVIESAVAEFSGVTEEYLQAGERLYGPYEWKTYDLLIMPPSFPYGGMENPNLTFVTPTLIAGDRSLTDTVMHEVGKGWSLDVHSLSPGLLSPSSSRSVPADCALVVRQSGDQRHLAGLLAQRGVGGGRRGRGRSAHQRLPQTYNTHATPTTRGQVYHVGTAAHLHTLLVQGGCRPRGQAWPCRAGGGGH